MNDDVVRQLVDKQQIAEALFRYCRGIDRCDVDLIRSAFYPEAVDDHGDNAMLAYEFAEHYVRERQAETEFAIHRVMNHLIELDGDVAVSEAGVFSIQQVKGSSSTQFSSSRYLDRFERRDGDWKVAYRLVVHDWHGSAELGPWELGTISAANFVMGARGENDVIIGGRDRLFRPIAKS
ncbi:nuclear transport factor 2 family protein [Dactylosporangium sp. NPDC000555]|uniref:nuclear transport factor 2 family protein n=1 Tax=Dactylosporangium sp. NPDC000555 TaxID=3154260 RepID=UPI003316E59C